MSTPERSQDPGEHGYGGTKGDYPAADEPDERPEPADDVADADDPREAPDPTSDPDDPA